MTATLSSYGVDSTRAETAGAIVWQVTFAFRLRLPSRPAGRNRRHPLHSRHEAARLGMSKMKKLHARTLVFLSSTAVLTLLAACAPGGASVAAAPSSPRTLVAVFAHPDDETLVAPALARYAREGVRVFLVIATDGRRGANTHARIPAGDSLAKIRAGEARCSARALGLEPPILLGFPDAGLADFAPWPGKRLDTLATRIDSVLRALRPSVVIAWGPEGGYGHSDHRLSGNVVTQIFQSGALPSTTPLFYPGFPETRTSTAPPWYGQMIHPVSSALLTASVTFNSADRQAAAKSVACHWSQATLEQQTSNMQALDHLWQGSVTFQQWGGARLASLFQ
jgi:LmbE family N-acetylglucosaminyl deacetylase